MIGQNLPSLTIHYLRLHWFKISVLTFLLFLVFKKDFSFTINLNAPDPTETTTPPSSQPVQQQTPAKRETFTEQAKQQSMTPAPERGVLDRFDFSSIIGGADYPLQENLYKLEVGIVDAFIQRFGKVARMEQKKFGIPASVILANALLHSQAGKSQAFIRANNIFGLACSTDWMGEQWEKEDKCYRAYENAWTSFRDHSFYLTTGRFAETKKLGPKDYKAWSEVIEEKGFLDSKRLEKQLIEVIEKWELYKLD